MKVDIQYQPSYALATVTLDAGESIQAESGAMVGMSAGLVMVLALVPGLPFIPFAGLGGVLAEIPRAALAAVIVAAAIAIIDVAGYRTLWVLRRDEFALAVVTAVGVVVLDVLLGVIVAVVLSLLVALSRIGRPHDAVLGEHPGEDGWVDLAAYPAAVAEPGLVVYRFDAPLVFVNVDRFRRRVEEALASSPGAEEWVVLDFEGIGAVDSTAADALHELVDHLGAMGATTIAVARANDEVLDLLGRAELCEPAGPLRVFPTINGAVRAFRTRT